MLPGTDLDVWRRVSRRARGLHLAGAASGIRAHHKAGCRRAGEQHGLLPHHDGSTFFYHSTLEHLGWCPELKRQEGAGTVSYMLGTRAKVRRDVRESVADAHDCNIQKGSRVVRMQVAIC